MHGGQGGADSLHRLISIPVVKPDTSTDQLRQTGMRVREIGQRTNTHKNKESLSYRRGSRPAPRASVEMRSKRASPYDDNRASRSTSSNNSTKRSDHLRCAAVHGALKDLLASPSVCSGHSGVNSKVRFPMKKKTFEEFALTGRLSLIYYNFQTLTYPVSLPRHADLSLCPANQADFAH